MFMQEYERWCAAHLEDPDLAAELKGIKGDTEAIEDRFAINLQFGTAGLRGVIGAGTNRMNIYTVRKATQGLAAYLLDSGQPLRVAIGYDSRIKSDLFSREAACVLAANGITVYLYPSLRPVPMVSFAVRQLGCSAGIMITASHNPAKYNGYKVYGPDGCQMTTEAADAVLVQIDALDIFDDIRRVDFEAAVADGRICMIAPDVDTAYYDAVLAQQIRPGQSAEAGLRLVYTPLNGAGNLPVRHILDSCGITDIHLVAAQVEPDGNFPTCSYPNPEIPDTMAPAIALAGEVGADLVLATDPDCDRVGIAVKDNAGQYVQLTGNEVGLLLLDYICAGRQALGTMPQHPVLIKSIVTSPMADRVASHYGVETINVLTGFKYIGEQILLLEQKGEAGRYVFGFEESCGYLAGTHVRDKDGVVASMLICEMAAYYNAQKQGLYEVLQRLYTQYGRYLSHTDSFSFEGLSGMEKMQKIMRDLRASHPAEIAGLPVLSVADYEARTLTDCKTGKATSIELPPADVLVYTLPDNAGLIVRPSGTEPKIKVYYTTQGKTLADAQAVQKTLAEGIKPLLV